MAGQSAPENKFRPKKKNVDLSTGGERGGRKRITDPKGCQGGNEKWFFLGKFSPSFHPEKRKRSSGGEEKRGEMRGANHGKGKFPADGTSLNEGKAPSSGKGPLQGTEKGAH